MRVIKAFAGNPLTLTLSPFQGARGPEGELRVQGSAVCGVDTKTRHAKLGRSRFLVPSPPPALPTSLGKGVDSGERVRVRGQLHTAGYTLLEVLLVGVLMSSLLGMGLKLYISAQAMTEVTQLAHGRLEQSRRLDHDIRAVIQQATGLADAAGNYRADADTLVLELPPEQGKVQRAVVSRAPSTGMPFIARMEKAEDAWQPLDFDIYSHPLSVLAFDTATPGLVRCEYQLALEKGERVPAEIPTQVLWAHPRGMQEAKE